MGRISLYRFLSAGCNGCDVQILECLSPQYRLEELGLEIASKPEEASLLVLTGGLNIKGEDELLKAYQGIREPKRVIAVGNCAITMEIFEGGYPMKGPPDRLLPVDHYIPGCPPRPQAILKALAEVMGVALEARKMVWQAPEGFRGRHELDGVRCIGCGACAEVCSSDAIEVVDEGDGRIIRVDYGRCSFCGFCQDECPTKALRLTGEYHLLTGDRRTMRVEGRVELARCTECGEAFLPKPQIEWILKRISEEKPQLYKELGEDIQRSMKICIECRRKINSIREAKRLLARINRRAKGK